MPIRTAASPRAWMMKGEATWKAPSAAAPLISVRRSNFGLKVCGVMIFPPAGLLTFLLAVIARSQRGPAFGRPDDKIRDPAIQNCVAALWIASRSLSSGAHSRDPLARNDGLKFRFR